MDALKAMSVKTLCSGLFGTVSSTAAFFGSEAAEGAMRLVILGLGILSTMVALMSAVIIVSINRHRNQIKAIEQAKAETRMCEDCRSGHEPVECPVPVDHRPENCPKLLKRKQSNWFRKILAEIHSEETTTK